MKVFRCDRCGNHYTQREHSHTIDIFEIVDGKRQYRNLLCVCPNATDALDLCPDCVISLINWIDSGATNGRKFAYSYNENDINSNKVCKGVKEYDNDY